MALLETSWGGREVFWGQFCSVNRQHRALEALWLFAKQWEEVAEVHQGHGFSKYTAAGEARDSPRAISAS